MTVLRKYGVLFFVVLLLCHCLFIYLGMSDLRAVSKLLFVPFLILYLFAISPQKPRPVVVCGLLFSFAGDLLLTGSGEMFFLLGMLAFIGTHVCNGLLFLKLQHLNGENRVVSASIIILGLLSGIVFKILQPHLGNFQWPILFYMCIISVMAILATRTTNNPSVKPIAIRCFIPGVALFVLSDTVLAFNKFLWHEPLVDIVVMATYGAAQYCLVRGFAKVSQVKFALRVQ